MSRKLYINLLYGMGYGSGMVEQGSEDNPEIKELQVLYRNLENLCHT